MSAIEKISLGKNTFSPDPAWPWKYVLHFVIHGWNSESGEMIVEEYIFCCLLTFIFCFSMAFLLDSRKESETKEETYMANDFTQ